MKEHGRPQRVVLLLTVILLVVGGLVVFAARFSLATFLAEQLEQRGALIASSLQPTVGAALDAGRYADLQDFLSSYRPAAAGLKGIRVKNRYGLAVAQWDESAGSGYSGIREWSRDVQVITLPVPEQLGSIELAVSRTENRRLLDQITGYAAAAVAFLVFLNSLFLLRHTRRATASAAEKVAAIAEGETCRCQSSHFQHVMETITDPFFVIDVSNFHIVMANVPFRKMFPGSALTCYELIHGKKSPLGGGEDWLCPILEVKKKKRPVVMERMLKDPSGEQRFFEFSARPILNDQGKLVQVAVYCLDITDRKKAQDAVEEALVKTQEMALQQELQNALVQKQKKKLEKAYGELKMAQSQMLQKEKMASIGQLAAGVAHEINNPMGYISSNLVSLGKHAKRLADFIDAQGEILAALPGSDQAQTTLAQKRKELRVDFVLSDLNDLIAESVEGADRVKNIVQNLKSFSRVDAAEESRVNIHDGLESTINIVWNEIKYKAALKREYGDLPMIKCFPQQLNQVFMNLLVNAAHAIEKDGEIVVRTWRQDENVMISVADNGSGIAPEHLNRLFEPFFTTKEVGKGTGLGLSIAYDIVKKHKGEIRVASEVGKGTTFAISLPLND